VDAFHLSWSIKSFWDLRICVSPKLSQICLFKTFLVVEKAFKLKVYLPLNVQPFVYRKSCLVSLFVKTSFN
jgi:hypothetical protein